MNEEQKKAMINVLKEQPREVSRHGSDDISDLEDDLKDLNKKQKEYDIIKKLKLLSFINIILPGRLSIIPTKRIFC